MMDRRNSFIYDKWLAQLLQRDVFQIVTDGDFIKKA